MSGELSSRDVQLVALSKDTVKAAANHKKRDGISFKLLADPKLAVIKQFGLLHRGAIEFSGPTITIAGLTLGLIPKVKTMAIPTTILCDESGVIQWIDQADDYRLRSNEARVLEAIDENFPRSSAKTA